MIAALLSAWWLLGLPCTSPAGIFEGYREDVVATGRLLSRGWSEAERQTVTAALAPTLAAVESRLGRRLGHPFTTVLAPDLAEVRRIVEATGGRRLGGSEVLGVAVPDASLLVIRGGYALGLDPARRTLAHELAHLVIHSGAEGPVPRWLDEGVAMWASGESLTADAESYLALLARMRGLYSLASLTHRFPEDHLPSSIAYQQSFLLVCYLEERFGPLAVERLLDLNARPAGAQSLLEGLTGQPEKAVEEEFGEWVAARRSLASAIGSAVNLWTISAVLALAAIARHVVVRRRKLRELDRVEADLDPDSPSSGEGEPFAPP